MKYFYFQMLKDKKIIHKTDGKKKPNKHSFPLQEEATEQTHVDSACLSNLALKQPQLLFPHL